MADETLAETSGNDTISASAGNDALAADQNTAALVEVEAPADVETSRDELHDSIDPHTGALTPEAVDLRRERGVTASGEQPSTEGEAPE